MKQRVVKLELDVHSGCEETDAEILAEFKEWFGLGKLNELHLIQDRLDVVITEAGY